MIKNQWHARGKGFKSPHLQDCKSLFNKDLHCFLLKVGAVLVFDGKELWSDKLTRRLPNGWCL